MCCNDFKRHKVAECWHCVSNSQELKQEFVIYSKAVLIETLYSSICSYCARCRDWMEELRSIFGGSWKGRRQDIKSRIFKEKLFMDTTPNLHVTPKLPRPILIIPFSNYSCNIHPPIHKLVQIHKYITST